MKIKLDENLGGRSAAVFRQAGHDVLTVGDQRLRGADDRTLIDICRTEQRCLVTMDLDFANPFIFRPAQNTNQSCPTRSSERWPRPSRRRRIA